MATSSREARRRRIIDGGSDRLAFITGQIRSLPSQPPSTSPSESQLRLDGLLPDSFPPPDQIARDRTSASTGSHENISDKGMLNNSADHDHHQSRSELLQPQMSTETPTKAPASESRDAIQPSPVASTIQSPSMPHSAARQLPFPLGNLPKLLTPNHVSTAIDASEYARMFSSLVIALLVISSRLRFSLGSIVSFGPVFFLLLTNATIVLGWVLLNHREDSSTATRQENASRMNGQDTADQVGNALEKVLMIKKIMDAVFIDFSIYAVIVICCLSFSYSNSA